MLVGYVRSSWRFKRRNTEYMLIQEEKIIVAIQTPVVKQNLNLHW